MHSIKRSLAVLGAIVALLTFAPVASAGSDQSFHLAKTCGPAPSEPLGYVCTVTHSDFTWIPPGTEVHYLSQDGNVVQASIAIKDGRTDGACTRSSDVDAVCVFDAGTGRLTQFHLAVVVTANADASIWHWDGTYWFGN